MTREDKIAAGWQEIAPNRWRIPDADPREQRTPANGYGAVPGRIVETGDGFVLRYAYRHGAAFAVSLRNAPADRRSLLVSPERRDDWRIERRAEGRILAHRVMVARRAQALDACLSALAESHPHGGYIRPARPRLRASLGLRTSRIPVARIYADTADEIATLGDLSRALDRAQSSTRKAIARIERPLQRAASRERERVRRQERERTETVEQREARRAATRERVRAHRARKRAEREAAQA